MYVIHTHNMQKRKRDPNVLRKELGELVRELTRLQKLFTSRSPLWKGNVYLMRRRCGQPNCRCTRGRLHEAVVLSDRSGDSPRTVPLNDENVDPFRCMTEDYSRFRQARARVPKIAKQIVNIVDALGEIRLEAGQKGRKKKRKRE
jgi:hypothetical protein